MTITHDNYFGKEAMMEYMSTSQFKAFEQCEARALAELKGDYISNKEAYKEGHFFEACLSGNEDNFILQNPDMISSSGATKGKLKSNYKRVLGSIEAFKQQTMFMEIISQCIPQVIFTGEIAGLAFKGCVDFFKADDNSGFDTKCMKDLKKVYSNVDGMRIQWFFAYGYHYQAAIYRELIKQTYGNAGEQHILAVSKEEIPDIAALCFTDEILDNALDIIKEYAPKYDKIKRGLLEPEHCDICDYCKKIKKITTFDVISEYE